MKVIVEQITSWKHAYREALATIGKEYNNKRPSDTWKKNLLLAEHSPIREVWYRVEIKSIPYWAHVHLVRHHIGVEKYVATQRDDRNNNKKSRNNQPQNNPVDMVLKLNAQSMINISRKRLCRKASDETRKAWNMVINDLKSVDPILWSCCVPECVYRGFCPEKTSCGYITTEKFEKQLDSYR